MKYLVKVAGSAIRPEVGAKAFVEQLQKYAADQYHVVQKGNTFEGLDKRYGFPVGSFQGANKGIDPRRLQIGQRIVVPSVAKQPVSTSLTPNAPARNTAAVTRGVTPKWTPKKWDITPEWTDAHQRAYEFIAQNEGFRSDVYNDTVGKPTIGYGFTAPELIKRGKLTQDEADEILRGYVIKSMSAVDNLPITTKLNDNQRIAMSDMVYHFGSGALRNAPDLLGGINSGDVSKAQAQLMRWTKQKKRDAKGNYIKGPDGKYVMEDVEGLVNRAKRVSDMYGRPVQPVAAYPVQRPK